MARDSKSQGVWGINRSIIALPLLIATMAVALVMLMAFCAAPSWAAGSGKTGTALGNILGKTPIGAQAGQTDSAQSATSTKPEATSAQSTALSGSSVATSVETSAGLSTSASQNSATPALVPDADGKVVLVDDENCLIVLSNFKGDGKDGYSMHIDAENRTKDTELMFSIDYATLDGWMCSPYWAQNAPAGQKISDTIDWSSWQLEGLDIGDITEFQLSFHVYDANDWSADSLVQTIFTVHPEGDDAVASFTHESDPAYTVILDDDNCTMWVESYASDNTGFTMTTFIRNKTDKTLQFSIASAAVNGWICDPYWGDTLLPHAMGLEKIIWYNDFLDKLGITDVTDITIALKVYDFDDWTADYLVDATYELYPLGEKAVKDYPRESAATDKVLVDDDKCTFTVIGTHKDDYGSFVMDAYVENKTTDNVVFSTSDASLNDTMCDPYFAAAVMPGKKALVEVSWASSALEDAGISIDDIKDIKFSLKVYPEDDWSADAFVDDSFEVEL